ncbi:MAG: hypothetical protein WBZ33_15990, partial [Thermoactinomyces sp.]
NTPSRKKGDGSWSSLKSIFLSQSKWMSKRDTAIIQQPPLPAPNPRLKGAQFQIAGSQREVHLIGYWLPVDPSEHVTEIQIPIAKRLP